MALNDPQDTLAYHLSRILLQHRDMSQVPMPAVVERLNTYMATAKSDASPEKHALAFYGLNHGFSLVRQRFDPYEPLPHSYNMFINDYMGAVTGMSVRAFYYLLIICTREARHNQSISSSLPKMAALFGDPVAEFFKASVNEDQIHKRLRENPPNCSVGDFVKCLQWQFYNSSWSSGFGGKAWGAVTDCLVRFVTGEYSAEMMTDTVWTLAHNNGPIFNKGHLYQTYTQALYTILDIQRSGQIPEAVLYHTPVQKFVPPSLVTALNWIKDQFPDKIGNYVDWYMVEGMGALHGPYHTEQKEQLKIFGPSKMAIEIEAVKLAAQQKANEESLKAEILKAEKNAQFEKNHYEVIPGEYVPIFHRAKAA